MEYKNSFSFVGSSLTTTKSAVLATIDNYPRLRAQGPIVSAWVPIAGSLEIAALIKIGPITPGASAIAKIQQAQDVNGTNATDVAGKTTAALTSPSPTGEMPIDALLGVRSVDMTGGYTHVRVSITVNGDGMAQATLLSLN